MIFLTYNDYPSGIFSSQVLDVCAFLNGKLNKDIRLVSLVSLRGYFKTQKKIRAEFPNAIVLPMFPGVGNWRCNKIILFFLFLLIRKQSVIARGVFATSLALSLKKIKIINKVCFDARGAYDAEFNEYDVSNSKKLNRDIFSIERNALHDSDFRIAVSYKLINYWKTKFGYNSQEHVVIPCTISTKSLPMLLNNQMWNENRNALGFFEDDVVFVYSGSSAGWQSFELVDDFLFNHMQYSERIKALFLVNKLPGSMKITANYSDRIVMKWLPEDQVAGTLACCDYGLLLREPSVTNSVASPVKFAEYLGAGLKVIISGNIGDYSDFVLDHTCGYVYNRLDKLENLISLSLEERKRNSSIAREYFSKEKYSQQYFVMINQIT